jgi:hypothetical protein
MRPLTPPGIRFSQQLAFGHLISESHEATITQRRHNLLILALTWACSLSVIML